MSGIGSRKAFKLVELTPARDVKGNPANSERTILNGWGNVSDARSSRSYDGQSNIEKFFEVKFRYQSNVSVNADTRLVLDGNRYTVQGIRKDKLKKFYWILTVKAKDFN